MEPLATDHLWCQGRDDLAVATKQIAGRGVAQRRTRQQPRIPAPRVPRHHDMTGMQSERVDGTTAPLRQNSTDLDNDRQAKSPMQSTEVVSQWLPRRLDPGLHVKT